jgi:plasmid stabilization system protein ParE
MNVILLPQAQSDLLEIAEPLFSKIIHKFELLESFPLLGPLLGGPLTGYRALTVGIFRAIYRIIEDDHIKIFYIRHCRRKTIIP